jgi:Tol biopolymer transport system component
VTISAPTSPPRPGSAVNHDELIEDARRRAWLRRIGIVACVLAAAVGTAIFLGVHLRGGINGRSAPPQGGSSGSVALTRVYAGESHIMVVDLSGRSRPRDLGPGWGASWSPEGRRLVFTYEVDLDATYGGGVGAVIGRGLGGGLERIFVMNADGSGRHLLTMPWLGSPRFEDSDPAWSPDGSRIAFTRTVWPAGVAHTEWSRGRSAVYVLDLAHGGPRRVSVTFDSAYGNVTWSPDGQRLAYLAPAGRCPYPVLHVTKADGTGDHVLATASRLPDPPGGCAQTVTPAWSPDGERIAFGRLTRAPPSIDLFLISPNGKHLQLLRHQPNTINVFPAWSPDGKRIAFQVGPNNGGPQAIAVIDRDGKHLQLLRHQPNTIDVFPTWSPDGKRIAFEVGSNDGGPGPHTLAVIDRDGSHRHTILHIRDYLYGPGPARQPR